MKGSPVEAGGGGGSYMAQPLAIVLIVMILGISYYLWRMHYLRSRAALLTVGAILLALIFVAVSPGLSIS